MLSSSDNETPPIFPIVCIGGSAGSLAAYIDILGQLPARSEMAIVIVSHRALDDPGRLLTLLSRATQMEVVEIADGMLLEANRIFVAPPQTEVETDGNALALVVSTRKHCGWPTLISQFLLSLSTACTIRTIAVIVSGTGFDGSSALAAVKKGGGWTLAQSDASYGDMPQAAIDTDHIDLVLTANEIGRYLASLSAHLRPIPVVHRSIPSHQSPAEISWSVCD